MIAALFPGQGSQTVGMGRDFYAQSPAAKRVLDEAEAALPGILELMWEGPEETLRLTANQQPALLAVGAAAFAAYREAGGTLPGCGAGHSLGEYTAYVTAGALALAEAVRLVHKRGSYMQEAVPAGAGAMAAILKTDHAHVQRVCEETAGTVSVANLNSPGQTVISGEAVAVAAASERLGREGARVVPLKVSAPFHCALMKPAADRLAEDLAGVTFSPAAFPIVGNVTADFVEDARALPALLTAQVTHTVRWVECAQTLATAGADTFLEFGSGNVLSGLMKRILPQAKTASVTDMQSLRGVL